MKILEKTVELGDMKFRVATDRNIAVKAFEEYPELIEYLVRKQKEANQNDEDFFVKAIKNKELSNLFEMEEKFGDLISFALPLMLEKAGDMTDAQAIIDYAVENGADSVFNSAMLEFLVQGFTQREVVKPKINFSMK